MMIRTLAGLVLFTLGLSAQDLPEGAGRQETEHTCSQCHEIDRVTSLRQDREAWNATMAKMTAYGMKSTEKDYSLVLDYLSTHFPADAVAKVNVNTASAIDLESALNLRRSQSAALIAYREKNGPFKSIDDLKKVPLLESAKLDEKRIGSHSKFIAAALFLCAAAISCSTKVKNSPDPGQVSLKRVKPLGVPVTLPPPPLGLPPVPVPLDNPATAQTIALGRRLFSDKRLSLNDSISCASCHNPNLHFTDRLPHSSGVGGKTGIRNAPTLLNAAFSRTQFWDGRAPSLEEQVGGPMANTIEMNQPHELAVSKLNKDPEMLQQFQAAFGSGNITIGKIEQAIATYERTLVSGGSAFDRYQYGSEKKALSPAALRGLAVFKDPAKGNCASCHLINNTYALFTDNLFHNLGVGVNDQSEITDPGRYSETHRNSDKGAFKTPSLRDVALTPPYMHDGSLKTLKDVVDFYAGHGNSNPYLDPRIAAINLNGRERADLVTFLESLTSQEGQSPQLPNSRK